MRLPFACVPKETSEGVNKVVIMSEIDMGLDQVNRMLLGGGLSRLYKVNEFIKVQEIPYLKSGKIAYRELFESMNDKK